MGSLSVLKENEWPASEWGKTALERANQTAGSSGVFQTVILSVRAKNVKRYFRDKYIKTLSLLL